MLRLPPFRLLRPGTLAEAARLLVEEGAVEGGVRLVAGGTDPNTGATATAEIYDPRTGTFAPTGSMTIGRAGATATRLQDGTVLVLGIEGNSADWHFSVGWTALISEKRIVFEVPSVNWAIVRPLLTENAVRDGEPAPEPIFEVGVSGQLKTYQSPRAGA